MTQFRKDPLSGRWVIIAGERSSRPRQLNLAGEKAANDCPFCAGNETATPPAVLLYNNDGPTTGEKTWQVRVVPNKFPALTDPPGDHLASGLHESKAGIGVHEVIIEHPHHVVEISELGEAEFLNLLKVYRQRMAELSKDRRWQSILVYKNQGERAGATLEHVHSQLIALPMVPQEIANEVAQAREYHAAHGNGTCVACDLVRRELSEGQRVVARNSDYVAVCPFASRFAYELCIWPTRHRSAFELSSDDELISLAEILREQLCRMASKLNHPAFNYIIHTAPLPAGKYDEYHWHIEILPKLNQAAGFEWGSGSFINPVAPEDAARRLRTGS